MTARSTAPHHGAVRERRLHPFALWSVLLIAISLVLPFTRLAPAIASVPLCWVLAVMLGVHTLIRYRWPGRTATERGRRPDVRDLLFATAGIVLGSALLSLLLLSNLIKVLIFG